jgi:hypothetical protein
MERDLPLPKKPKGTTLAPQPPGIRGMSVESTYFDGLRKAGMPEE